MRRESTALLALLAALGCAAGPVAPRDPSTRARTPVPPPEVVRAPPPKPAPPVRTPAPEVEPAMDGRDAQALLDEARTSIDRTAALLTAISAERLAVDAAERLAVARDLLRQARAAVAAGDAPAASNLARKAETLAEDLEP